MGPVDTRGRDRRDRTRKIHYLGPEVVVGGRVDDVVQIDRFQNDPGPREDRWSPGVSGGDVGSESTGFSVGGFRREEVGGVRLSVK